MSRVRLQTKDPIVERRKIADKAIVFHLPMPPSTNHLFANVQNGRIRTREYKAWSEEAGWMIREKWQGTIHGPVKISVRLEDKHPRRDCDNTLKPLIDLLTPSKHGVGVIDGDHSKILRKLSVEWADVEGAVVTVERAA